MGMGVYGTFLRFVDLRVVFPCFCLVIGFGMWLFHCLLMVLHLFGCARIEWKLELHQSTSVDGWVPRKQHFLSYPLPLFCLHARLQAQF